MGNLSSYLFVASPALLAVFVLSNVSRASAQSGQYTDYFPLQVGNSWTYFEVLNPPPDFLPDTLLSGGGTVLEQVILEDTTYFRISGPIRGSSVRKDELGRIWGRRDTDIYSYLIYDFTLADSAQVDMGPNHPFFPDRILTVYRDLTVQTHLGTFENCIQFNFEHKAAVDADWSYTFAPDFGVIKYGGGPGFNHNILQATLNGAIVDDTEESPEFTPDFSLLGNYPNPFEDHTTISFIINAPSQVNIRVFDVTGRMVQATYKGYLSPGSHHVSVAMQGFAPGIYFYSVRAGHLLRKGKMVLLK